MSEAALREAVHELAQALPGINATKYLSAAGLVVLLYDHLLLLDSEISQIWAARWTLTKGLWLLNRYLVPLCLLINAHVLSGLSTAGLSTAKWLPTSAFLGITSLAVANIFIVQRVWALWGRNGTVLKTLAGVFTIVYIITYCASGVAFSHLIPHLVYSPPLRTCILTEKPTITIVMYAVPVAMDLFVFVFTCWNAFDRPRHMQTAITKQLVTDGVIYFVCLMTLRLSNIIIVAVADTSFSQLGLYVLWSMITVLVNRMLILSGTVEVHGGPDPSGRQTPFNMPDRSSYSEYEEDEDTYPLPTFVAMDGTPYKAQVV